MFGYCQICSELKPLDYYITNKSESQYFFEKNLEKFSEFLKKKRAAFLQPQKTLFMPWQAPLRERWEEHRER